MGGRSNGPLMETVDHDGRTTAYRTVAGDGEGPTMLYVHGSGGAHQGWVRQYAPDGPAHPAVALDLSGHGNSVDFDGVPHDDPLHAYARDVVAVADAVDADVLVGNSMGGAVALRVALDFDFALDALVLAGTGAALPVDDDLLDLFASDFDAAIDRLHGEDVLFHDADERTLARSRETMRAAGQDVVHRDFAACDGFDVRERLGDVDVPALAIVGEHDRLTPPAYHRELTAEIPDCRYRELDGAAHLAMLERSDAFNAALAEFLAEIR